MTRKNQQLQRKTNNTGAQTRFIATSKFHSGPIPSPEELAEYNNVIPNGAERIFNQFEKQTDHRIKQENRVILHDLIQAYCGLFFGFIVVMSALYFSYLLIEGGKNTEGSVFAGGTIVSVAASFVYGIRQKNRHLKESSKQNKP